MDEEEGYGDGEVDESGPEGHRGWSKREGIVTLHDDYLLFWLPSSVERDYRSCGVSLGSTK